MKITTNPFSLTRSDYFQILLFRTLRSHRFFYLLALLISFLGTKITTESIIAHTVFFLLVSLIYSGYWVVECSLKAWIFRDNQFLFVQRTCEIDHEFITTCLPDGTLIKVNFSRIIKTVKKKKYCLLYYSSDQFIYIPITAMSNPIDLQALMTLIQVKSV